MDFMEVIGKYKNNAANIVLVIIALMVANRINGMQSANTALLNEKIKTESNRNTVLADISRTEKQFASYKKAVNKKDMNAVVTNLQTFARDSSVTILSMKPLSEKAMGDLTRYPYELTVAGTYHKIGKFISKLESSPDIYMVENMNHRISTESKDKDKKGNLAVDLRISTMRIKDQP
jgi:Tfp pilus assembly protein PilO